MLVLARMRDESIIIGDEITVTVADIRGDKVRLGIAAPRHVSVHRKEVYDQIRRENQAAAGLQPGDVAGAVKSPSMRAGNGPAPTGDTPEARLLMRAALDQARHSAAGGGLPIGAVLVRNDQIIGRGCDRSIQSGDPTATAVIDCLRNAGRQLAYGDTVLYTTLLPDHVAAGAVVQLGIGRVVIGEAVHARDGAPPKPPVANLLRAAHVEVLDLHDSACVEMVDTFMREHPERWRSSY